jgi:UDPglucose 6-dehydrogenase
MESSIVIIGTGYVGLTTGACFAHLGSRVVCADNDNRKISSLRKGRIPIKEAGLPGMVKELTVKRRLEFTTDVAEAVSTADFVFLCLPTPQGQDGQANLGILLDVVGEIAGQVKRGAVVVNKSTAPVGTAARIADIIDRDDVEVASNPEFLREGTAVRDFLRPDRVVIGAENRETSVRVAELYRDIDATKLLVNTATAELIKYASNAFLATKISFANSITNLCEAVGANAHEVLEGMGRDERIGGKFLKPGPGWGGSCFPKDTYALLSMAEAAGYEFDLLKAVVHANEKQLALMVDKIDELLERQMDGSKVAVWGLAFKAGTDDTRQSPALEISQRLLKKGAAIKAYDPAVETAPEGIEMASSALSACEDADILVVLTEWPEFASAPLDTVANKLRMRRVLDTRNILDTRKLSILQFEFQSVGNFMPYSLVSKM